MHSSPATKAKTERIPTDFLDEASLQDKTYTFPGLKDNFKITTLDTKMAARHYNVSPAFVTKRTRELLWPSLITKGLYLSGEIPACNPQVRVVGNSK